MPHNNVDNRHVLTIHPTALSSAWTKESVRQTPRTWSSSPLESDLARPKLPMVASPELNHRERGVLYVVRCVR